MPLAIFDLDNTLLAGDSDYLWGLFLAERGLVDGDHYEQENARFVLAVWRYACWTGDREVLRVRPILGRTFLPGEDEPGADPALQDPRR